MDRSELGTWAPLPVHDAVDVFAGAGFRWWIGGGRALELHAGRTWRDHDDTDVGIARCDAAALRRWLGAWDLHVAAAGKLSPWHDGDLLAAEHQNNVWCRRRPTDPWVLDVTIGDGDADAWVFRRDPRVRVPWAEAVLTSAEGVPYLAPELLLLFKSRDPRPKDEVDAREVLAGLDTGRREWLARRLPADHPWRWLAASAS